MSARSTAFELELVCGEQVVRLAVPVRVFATAAEQLRWDALREGHMGIEDWANAKAYVAPSRGNQAGPTREFQFAITLIAAGRPVHRCYQLSQLQAFSLFLQTRLDRMQLEKSNHYEIHWHGEREWGKAGSSGTAPSSGNQDAAIPAAEARHAASGLAARRDGAK